MADSETTMSVVNKRPATEVPLSLFCTRRNYPLTMGRREIPKVRLRLRYCTGFLYFHSNFSVDRGRERRLSASVSDDRRLVELVWYVVALLRYRVRM